MIFVGFDPSTDGAAYAVLRCGGGERTFIDKGDILVGGTDIETLFDRYHVEVVAIERPPPQLNVHVMPARIAALGLIKAHQEALWLARAKAGSLIATAYIAGALGAYARSDGRRVVEFEPNRARAIVGASRRTKGTDQDAVVKNTILTLISGWPKVSNTHTRDAAVVALAAAWT